MQEKINKLSNLQAIIIIVLVGAAVFLSGLVNPFIGDDTSQIVESIPVHSISNLKVFFEGGTFYNGNGTAPLTGAYYRPLMTTAYSAVYSLFGAHPVYFHILQLLFHIGGVIFLFLFFKYSFKTIWALALALAFLVHPMNSQAVMAIPALQDAMYFFFGILSLWSLVTFKSIKSLGFVALCLVLSLLSKEAGALFVLLSLAYLVIFDRKRLLPFSGFMLPIAVLYLALRTYAVGWFTSPVIAPVGDLDIGGRLLTTPSVILFYFEKFLFPYKLSTAYYWVHPTFSVQYTLIPLLIEIALVVGAIYLGRKIFREAKPTVAFTWLFFLIWVVIGIVAHLPLTTLDMTACTTWSYFINAGLLGLLGVSLVATRPRWLMNLSSTAALSIVIVIILLLGIRTSLRGFDYRNAATMARHDIKATSDQYIAYNIIAIDYLNQKDYQQARDYAQKSVEIYSTAINNNTLGETAIGLKDYKGAYEAFNTGLQHQGLYALYMNLCFATAFYGNVDDNEKFLMQASQQYPNAVHPWLYLAILEYNQKHNIPLAKQAITKAHEISDGQLINIAYETIMNEQPLHITN